MILKRRLALTTAAFLLLTFLVPGLTNIKAIAADSAVIFDGTATGGAWQWIFQKWGMDGQLNPNGEIHVEYSGTVPRLNLVSWATGSEVIINNLENTSISGSTAVFKLSNYVSAWVAAGGNSNLSDVQCVAVSNFSATDNAVTVKKVTLYASGQGTTTTTGNRRIYVSGSDFMVDGKKIWISGANTPWKNFNEFGEGSFTAADQTWWRNHLSELKSNGVNAVRVWINCESGWAEGITLNSDGSFNKVSANHWSRVDWLFDIAKEYELYIMATLISFDHFTPGDSGNPNKPSTAWRNMITNSSKIDSFVNGYTIPFVNRYKDNPYLWSIDVCNEIDWLYERSDCGNISLANLGEYIAKNAAAIHKNSDILVTAGFASSKYSGGDGSQTNIAADSYLKARNGNDTASTLDFWSAHYYDWVGEWYGNPLYLTPTGNRQGNNSTGWYGGWQLPAGKPALLGEFAAKGHTQWSRAADRSTFSSTLIIDNYRSAFSKGWAGLMPWSSNGVDNAGALSDFKAGVNWMRDNNNDLIFPKSTASNFVAVTGITGVATSMTAGTPLTLSGTVAPTNATNKSITWSVQSAGTTGATVSGSTLSATAAGTVTVRATVANGASNTTNYTKDFSITVTMPYVAVTDITGVATSMTAGTPLTLAGTVAPANATNKTITWSVQSAGNTGATVSGNTLNATAAGTVTVRATIANGATSTTNYTKDFSITVTVPYVAVTGITGVATSMTAGTPLTLSGTVAPTNATNKTITWSVQSAGTTGATISGSTLSATAAGTVTVRATIANGATSTTNYTKDFSITVTMPYVAVTDITGVASAMTAGTPLTLAGTVAPANATNKTITWSVQSAGTTGATVSGSILSATAAGTVTVRATVANGATSTTNYTKDFNITVSAAAGFPWSSPDSGGTNLLAWGANNTDYMFFHATDTGMTRGTRVSNMASLLVSGTALKVTYTGTAPYVIPDKWAGSAQVNNPIIVTGSPNVAYYTYDAILAAHPSSNLNSLYGIWFGAASACSVLEVDIVPYTPHTAVTGITGVATSMTAGTALTLTGTVAPTNATNKTITWSVQNVGTTGATISGNTMHALEAGTVTVRATVANGASSTTNYTKDFSIAVSAAPGTTLWTSTDTGGTSLLAWGANNTDYMFFHTTDTGMTRGARVSNLASLLVPGTALKVTYTGTAPYVIADKWAGSSQVNNPIVVTGSSNVAYYTYNAILAAHPASNLNGMYGIWFGAASACSVQKVEIVSYSAQ